MKQATKKPLLQVASDGTYELIVEGVISGEMFWGDEFTPDMVREELAQADGKAIRVIINSPGGEVFAGAAIYNALLQYQGRKTVRVDGVAASMASVIAMVGDEIYMSPGSTMMIHRPLVGTYGNVDDLKKAIEMLESIEETILPIYMERTGLSRDEVFELLEAETWLSPEKAVELGFADKAVPEDEKPDVFAKVRAMLDNKQFAFSMKAVHDSLEDYVKKQDTVVSQEKEEEVEDDNTTTTAPAEEDVKQTNEAPATDEATDTSGAGGADEKDGLEYEETGTESETEEKQEEVTEPQANIKPVAKKEKETPMPKNETAADMVVAQADPVATTQEAKKMTKVEARKLIVEALAAKYGKDEARYKEVTDRLNAEMVIDGTAGEPLFGQEVLANDIRQAYNNVGRVGGLVNRIDIDGAETFRQLVETAGNGFTEVALGGTKDMDQPAWTGVTFEPFEWALIVAWLDGVQKRSPIAVYNQIVRYIAREYAKLEDKIVLTYAGATIDGEARPATGLVPILTTANRVTSVASYSSGDVLSALAEAYGAIESDDTITLVANRKTWANLAVTVDGDARPLFTVVGEQVAAGALGTFNVVLSSQLDDGDVVVGAYSDYNLVTRGGLEYLFSREATVGSGENALNLFTNDASALRADVDITGKPVVNTSFQLLQFATDEVTS